MTRKSGHEWAAFDAFSLYLLLLLLVTALTGCPTSSNTKDIVQDKELRVGYLRIKILQKSEAVSEWYEHQLQALKVLKLEGTRGTDDVSSQHDFAAILEAQASAMKSLLKEGDGTRDVSMWYLHQARAVAVLEYAVGSKIGCVSKQQDTATILEKQRSAMELLVRDMRDNQGQLSGEIGVSPRNNTLRTDDETSEAKTDQ